MRPTADHQVLDTGVERIGGFVRLVPDSPASRGSREAVIPRTYKYKLLWWNSFALRLLFARFPNAGGSRQKSAATNGQISFRSGDLLAFGCFIDGPARHCLHSASPRSGGAGQGRPASSPRGGDELFKPGLAGFCGLVFAKHKSKRETSASALCERSTLTSLNLFLGPDELDIS
jgi:hypothetical protein